MRVLAVAMICAVAFTASPAPATTSSEVLNGTKIFSKINDLRLGHDRPALKRNKCLQRLAGRQAQRMANQQRMFHSQPSQAINKCGLSSWGENVAYHWLGPLAIVQAWWHSPDHKSNLLGGFRITGVAVRKSGGYYWAVQVFGRK
jgi:uncharacterized protein YkwD